MLCVTLLIERKACLMPDTRLARATFDDYDALYNLAQLYQHDFSEFLPGDVDDKGIFQYMDVRRYLTDKEYKAYLARIDNKLGGFVLITSHLQHWRGPGRYVAEFFVMRRFRRQGIGRKLAFQAFDTYRGHWEVAEVGPNTPAQAFWRKVIGEYTHGRFEESRTLENSLTIIWQTFDSSQWPARDSSPG